MKSFRAILSYLLTGLTVFLPFAPSLTDVIPTSPETRIYTDGTLHVSPDPEKFLTVDVPDTGTDIYAPLENAGFGYRYGPSILTNADGSLDVFFAAPGVYGEWDWITYRHSPDGGQNWTDEKKVLGPTAGSEDAFSTCDPGAICFGGWWYIGYTSTTDDRGVFNHVYVARSRTIEGPYEKWNGKGWGGEPKAIITFDGDADDWGAGEPSFVVKDDTLYIYYTWHYLDERGSVVRQTRVATADASDENWPLTICAQGVAIAYADGLCDSADVKYVEDFGKFLAISTSQRFTKESCISFYVSDDGLRFEKLCDKRVHIAPCCHNAGLASRPNGHIRMADPHYIGYAYGSDWGKWCTRLQRIEIGLGDTPGASDDVVVGSAAKPQYAKQELIEPCIGISDRMHVYMLQKGQPRHLHLMAVTPSRADYPLLGGVRYTGYDSAVVRVFGGMLIPVGTGDTVVTAVWRGHSLTIPVHVR